MCLSCKTAGSFLPGRYMWEQVRISENEGRYANTDETPGYSQTL